MGWEMVDEANVFAGVVDEANVFAGVVDEANVFAGVDATSIPIVINLFILIPVLKKKRVIYQYQCSEVP
jgi:hypothetical protein